MDNNLFKSKVASGLEELMIDYQEKQIDELWQYMNFLLEENRKYNLTGITDHDQFIIKHFFDSLIFFSVAELKGSESLLDVGTGAGFPGLVLKIMVPEIELVLLDSQLKRINFLKKLINRLGLNNVTAVHSRAEQMGHDDRYRESFTRVVSRAVASIDILAEYTLPFVKVDGLTVLYKGPDYKHELSDGESAISRLGGTIDKVEKVNVPDLSGERFLIFIKKVSKTDKKFPRRPGIPKKRPL